MSHCRKGLQHVNKLFWVAFSLVRKGRGRFEDMSWIPREVECSISNFSTPVCFCIVSSTVLQDGRWRFPVLISKNYPGSFASSCLPLESSKFIAESQPWEERGEMVREKKRDA